MSDEDEPRPSAFEETTAGDAGATGAPEPMRGWWIAPGIIAAAAIIVVGIVTFRGDDAPNDVGPPPASEVEPPSVQELIAAATAYAQATAAVAPPPASVQELIAAATAYAQAEAATTPAPFEATPSP